MNKLDFSPIKQFKIYHVYEYYDEPIVYSFLSETGILFLANFVDYGLDESETWLYLPISYKELSDIETSKVSLRHLIKNSSSSMAYFEKITSDSSIFYVEDVSAIDDKYLPDEDSYIEFASTKKISNEELFDTVTTDNRYEIDISFKSKKEKYEMPVTLLSNLLSCFQNLLTALLIGKSAKRITSSKKIEQNFVGTFAGSFGIRLLSENPSSLIKDEEEKPYKKIVELFEETNTEKNLKHQSIVDNYGWLALKHFSKLSDQLETINGGRIEVGIPKPGIGVKKLKSSFKSDNIQKFINEIGESSVSTEEEISEISGSLTRYDSSKQQFSITTEDDLIYKGIVQSNDTSFTVPSKGKAKILIKTTEDKMKETIKKEMFLKKWTNVNN